MDIEANDYRPDSTVFHDVNHAYTSILCDIVHGPTSGTYVNDPSAEIDPVASMLSQILGIPAKHRKSMSLQSKTSSRNGPVHKFDLPRLWIYTDPTCRVLQARVRRCNPFFHLYEAMWFLAGRNDVASLTPLVPRMIDFSDDGETFHGAYGYRWRHHFGGDQLSTIIQTLRQNPESRRCVLQMWDCDNDLQDLPASIFGSGKPEFVPYSKDVPCNTHAYVQIRDGHLDLAVMNRSNDIFWGMLGSNYVTFTFLLEYLAGMIGVPVGFYHHFTVNAHYYTEVFNDEKIKAMHDEQVYAHVVPPAQRVPLVSTPENFDRELQTFVQDPYNSTEYTERFFREIAVPMMDTHRAVMNKEFDYALTIAKEDINQADWSKACCDWIVDGVNYKKYQKTKIESN